MINTVQYRYWYKFLFFTLFFLIKLEKYNFGKWSQMMKRLFIYIL